MSTLQKFRGIARSFWRDRRGNFAIITAFSAIPMFGLAGLSLDYVRMYEVRGKYQQAAETAALAATLHMLDDTTGNETLAWANAQIKGQSAFKAALPSYLFNANPLPTMTWDSTNALVKVVATGNVGGTLSQILGVSDMPFSVEAEVNSKQKPVEIALVLDTTYSMVGAKWAAAKEVSKNFVDEVLRTTSIHVKVGLVPFAEYVKIDTAYKNQPWIAVENTADRQNPAWCQTFQDVVAGTCRTERQWRPEFCPPQPPDIDGVPQPRPPCQPGYWWDNPNVGCQYKSRQVCYPASTTPTAAWQGCVGMRPGNYATSDDDYSAAKLPGLRTTNGLPGGPAISCPNKAVVALSNNRAALKTVIDQVQITPGFGRSTYIPAGVTWGLKILSEGQPFAEGKTDAEMAALGGQKYLILMTDGDNMAFQPSPNSPRVQATNNTNHPKLIEANQQTLAACQAAKDDNVIVYTVSFGASVSDRTKAMLQGCASGAERYFHAQAPEDLARAFEEILNALKKIYVSR